MKGAAGSAVAAEPASRGPLKPALSARALYALASGGFVVITTEFAVIGLLPWISRDLGIATGTAGLLTTGFAAAAALAGPWLTAQAQRFERRRVFVGVLLIYVITNLIGALAPGFGVLVAVRLLQGAVLPVYWALASASAAERAAPGRSGRAVATVYFGITIGAVVGVPLLAFIADELSWRYSLAAISALGAASAALLVRQLPQMPTVSSTKRRSGFGLLANRSLCGQLAISGLTFAAMFLPYTYFSELALSKGLSPSSVSLALLWFGLAGVLGNWVAGRMVERSAVKATAAGALALAAGLGAIGAPGVLGVGQMAVILVVWGAAHGGLFLANQVRVMNAAPESAPLAASLNISFANIGIASGSFLGAWIIGDAGLAALAPAGAALALIAVAGLAASRGTMPEDKGKVSP